MPDFKHFQLWRNTWDSCDSQENEEKCLLDSNGCGWILDKSQCIACKNMDEHTCKDEFSSMIGCVWDVHSCINGKS